MTIEQLKPIHTRPGMGRGLVLHDERSRNFRSVDLLGQSQQELIDKVWRRGQAYNQGDTSTCVPQTGKGCLNSSPMSEHAPYHVRSKYSIDEWYDGARDNDEWPGRDYEGSSGLGMLRYLKALGLIREYRACFGLQDMLLTLSHLGPILLGVWWKQDMFEPDDRGLIRPTGSNAGGHEVELFGNDVSNEEVIGMNSWGEDWGDRGRFRMKWEDLGNLVAEDGDAYVIIR